MSRVKRGVTSHAKHKKTLDAAKGFYGRRKNTIRTAKAAVDRAMQYATRDRKVKKRTTRLVSRLTVRFSRTWRSRNRLRLHRSLRRPRRRCRQLRNHAVIRHHSFTASRPASLFAGFFHKLIGICP